MWSLATLLALPLALVTSYEDHVNILNLNAEENAVVVEAWTGFIKDSGTMKLLLDGLQLTKTHKYGMLDSKFGLEDVYVDPDVVEEVMNFGVDVVRSLEDDKTLARLFRQARGIFRHEKFLVEVVLLSMASRVITKICELTATILHSLNHSKPHVSFTLAKLTFSIADLLGGVRHLNYLGLSRQNVKDVRNLMQFIDNHYFNFGVYDRIPESNIYQRNKHAWDHMINCTRDLVAHLEDGRYLEGLMKNLSRFLSITDPYMLEKLMERIYYVEPVEWSLDTKELTQKDWKNWTGWVKKLSYTMVRTDSALLEKFLEIIYYIPQALVKQSTLYPFSRSEMKSLYKCLNSVAVKIMLLLQNTVRAPLSLHFLREF